jgi:hypothetical protein
LNSISPPELQAVPIEAIKPHEIHDTQRNTPLLDKIRQDGVLRNPIIVTPIHKQHNRYMLLDGTNRHLVFEKLQVPHTLVQIVHYNTPQVQLLTWHHLVTGIEPGVFLGGLNKLADIFTQAVHFQEGQARIANGTLAVMLRLHDGRAIAVETRNQLSLSEKTRLIRDLVNYIIQSATLYRTAITDIQLLREQYPKHTALCLYAPFSPADLMTLVEKDELAPAGVTRHIIQGRALHVNYPLHQLDGNASTEEKNRTLQLWIQERYAQRGIRLYQEATYLFDE